MSRCTFHKSCCALQGLPALLMYIISYCLPLWNWSLLPKVSQECISGNNSLSHFFRHIGHIITYRIFIKRLSWSGKSMTLCWLLFKETYKISGNVYCRVFHGGHLHKHSIFFNMKTWIKKKLLKICKAFGYDNQLINALWHMIPCTFHSIKHDLINICIVFDNSVIFLIFH